VSSEGQTITGTVRIGAPDGFGTVFLAPRRVCGRSPTGIPSARAYLHEAAPIVAREDLKKHPFIGFVEDLLFAPQLDYSDLIGADVEPPSGARTC
jgi:hypothetical protein